MQLWCIAKFQIEFRDEPHPPINYYECIPEITRDYPEYHDYTEGIFDCTTRTGEDNPTGWV